MLFIILQIPITVYALIGRISHKGSSVHGQESFTIYQKKKFSRTSNIGQSVQRETNSSTRTVGQRVKQSDTRLQTVAFRNSANASKI